jgi:hypothetical protein
MPHMPGICVPFVLDLLFIYTLRSYTVYELVLKVLEVSYCWVAAVKAMRKGLHDAVRKRVEEA